VLLRSSLVLKRRDPLSLIAKLGAKCEPDLSTTALSIRGVVTPLSWISSARLVLARHVLHKEAHQLGIFSFSSTKASFSLARASNGSRATMSDATVLSFLTSLEPSNPLPIRKGNVRKFHKKSRTGCQRCRARRVKASTGMYISAVTTEAKPALMPMPRCGSRST
jgi:hypothetical protein